MLYLQVENRDVLLQLRLSVLTGEHENYSQIITKDPHFYSIYDYFALLTTFKKNTFNFHQNFKDKLSSYQPSHMQHQTQNK